MHVFLRMFFVCTVSIKTIEKSYRQKYHLLKCAFAKCEEQKKFNQFLEKIKEHSRFHRTFLKIKK